jgi:GntR family transcriptional regulator, transcriptional repressor for pyruvate dehydrogenase complex
MATTDTADRDRLDAFPPVRLRSAADVVLAVLVDALRGGAYAPGDMLPKERELAERLSVSRPVLRQAFAVLRDAGVISARRGPGGGTVVESLASLQDVLAHIQGDTRHELRQVLEMRRAVEPYAALLCSQGASDEDLAMLDELAARLPGQLDDRRAFYATDLHFHVVVGELSRNPLLARVVRETLDHISMLREPYPYGVVDLGEAVENQRTLLDALRSRERERVLDAMDEHLGSFERVMLGFTLPRG